MIYKKIIALMIMFNLTLVSCGSGLTSNNDDDDDSVTPILSGEQVRVTPSPFQQIEILFDLEFLENSQVQVTTIEKNTFNELNEETITYDQDETVINFDVTHEEDIFGFIVTLTEDGDFFNIEMTQNDEDINNNFNVIDEDS